jgi:gamma-glutamyltranspeptidase / glutathione hydrolase
MTMRRCSSVPVPRHAAALAGLVLAATALAACQARTGSADTTSAGRASNSAPAIPARRTPSFPVSYPYAAGAKATFAEHAMVASDDPLASAAGIEILQRGGNAVDAAVAVGFALAVTYQEAGNIGGGGFMLVRLANGETAAIDYREIAPLAATRDMYLDAQGNKTDRSLDGPLASGVPGSVAGLTTVLKRHGTLPLADVMAPAIRLAADGFVATDNFAKSVRDDSARIARFPNAAAVFLPGGRVPAVGSRLVQPQLARTLRLIAERGADVFYRGEIADSLVAEMRRGGGIITREDLARYAPVWRTPIRSTYRGYTLFTMPPASSGGITITETLNILETWDSLPAFGSAAYAHVLGSAYQRAFIDRNARLCDPAFCQIPVEHLTSKSYAQRLRATIDPARATPTPALERTILEGPSGTRSGEGTETTHYSVVDAMGNAVATTTTTNGLYGSGVLVRGAGFFMNNEMDDLAAKPGTPNQFGLIEGEQNAVAPGKRPLSAMSPTIVLDPRGEVLLVLGARGGPRIITSTSQVILNVIDHRMSIADAMAAPRLHHQSRPDTLRFEPNGVDVATADSLRAMGHAIGAISNVGLVNAIMRVRGGWEAVPEPRRRGGIAGY